MSIAASLVQPVLETNECVRQAEKRILNRNILDRGNECVNWLFGIQIGGDTIEASKFIQICDRWVIHD